MTNRKIDNDEQIFFYEQDFYVFSNFSSFKLIWQGIEFDTSEAAYHWSKFMYCEKIQKEILSAKSAHEAFKIAEKNKFFIRKYWNEVKISVMEDILWAKVKQHPYVFKKLIESGKRELIEDSWRDDFWGWGESHNGRNELGKLWMKIRKKINGN
jgi:hypothetical protein